MLICAHARGLSLQGAPRWGRQHLGYPPGGTQDRFAAATVRTLLGDRADSLVLECLWQPPEMRFETECLFVVTGAPAPATFDGSPLSHATVHHARPGQTLRWRPAPRGLRTYLGVQGGLEPAAEPGTFAFHPPRDLSRLGQRRPPATRSLAWAPAHGRLRVLPGPEWYAELEAELAVGRWRISPRSSGMGLRLRGTHLERPGGCDILSAPVADGTVQLTPNGPLILLRDRQTIGGYARILRLVDADVDWAAQLRPGDPVALDLVDEIEATQIAAARSEALAALSLG